MLSDDPRGPPLRHETILFDLDGTLVHTAPDVARGLNRILSAVGYAPFLEDEVADLMGGGLVRLMERAFARRDDPSATLLAEVRARAFLQEAADAPAGLSRVYDGVPEGLETLKRTGHRLAVCTNKPEGLAKTVLRDLGLLNRFDAVLGGGSTASKPAAAPVLEAIRRAGGRRASTVMVGDSATDLEAARNAGVPCILVTYGYHHGRRWELSPDAWVDRFDRLPRALRRLGSASTEDA